MNEPIDDLLCAIYPDLAEIRREIWREQEQQRALQEKLINRLLITNASLIDGAKTPVEKRHLTVSEAARLYGYTPEEMRRMAIEERKLRFIPAGKTVGRAYKRIKFDRLTLEEDFRELMIGKPPKPKQRALNYPVNLKYLSS